MDKFKDIVITALKLNERSFNGASVINSEIITPVINELIKLPEVKNNSINLSGDKRSVVYVDDKLITSKTYSYSPELLEKTFRDKQVLVNSLVAELKPSAEKPELKSNKDIMALLKGQFSREINSFRIKCIVLDKSDVIQDKQAIPAMYMEYSLGDQKFKDQNEMYAAYSKLLTEEVDEDEVIAEQHSKSVGNDGMRMVKQFSAERSGAIAVETPQPSLTPRIAYFKPLEDPEANEALKADTVKISASTSILVLQKIAEQHNTVLEEFTY